MYLRMLRHSATVTIRVVAMLALASAVIRCSSGRTEFAPLPQDAGPPAPFTEPPEAGADADAGALPPDDDVECAGETTNV